MFSSGATTVLFFIAISNTNLLILAPEEPADAGEGPFPFYVFAPVSWLETLCWYVTCLSVFEFSFIKTASGQFCYLKSYASNFLVHVQLMKLCRPVGRQSSHVKHVIEWEQYKCPRLFWGFFCTSMCRIFYLKHSLVCICFFDVCWWPVPLALASMLVFCIVEK